MLASLRCNMDNKLRRIYIQVGESRYPLWVNPKEEPIFREAARMVNRRLVAYNTKYRSSHLSNEDVLAMAAIDLAVMCQRQNVHTEDASTEADLAKMVNDLQQFLDQGTQQTDVPEK